jgi:hypothetical protein
MYLMTTVLSLISFYLYRQSLPPPIAQTKQGVITKPFGGFSTFMNSFNYVEPADGEYYGKKSPTYKKGSEDASEGESEDDSNGDVDRYDDQGGYDEVITPGGRLHIPDECPVVLRVLMEALWASKKEDRPTAVQCVAFLMRACAPIMAEARAWESNAESAAKMKRWLVGDLAIPVPRAQELFEQFDYDTLMTNRKGDISDMLGAEFVVNSPIYKAMGRELDALKMLNEAVEQEPLKGALAKACEDAEKEEERERGEQKCGETMQETLGRALDDARKEAAARNKNADEEKDEKEGKGDDGDDDGAAAAVPLSPFSLAIAAQIEVEEAKGGDADYALLDRLASEDLPAERALDIVAHEAQVACEARKAELDVQMAAAKKAKDYKLCNKLKAAVAEAGAQLETATDARAKAWAELGGANADAVVSGRSKVKNAKTAIIGVSRLKRGGEKQAGERAEEAEAEEKEARAAQVIRKAEEKEREEQLPPLVWKKLRDPNCKLDVDEQIECLDACIKYGEAQADNAKDRDLLMVIGNTGAGKSTMVNFIAGCTMERVTRKKAGFETRKAAPIIRTVFNSKVKEVMTIGHSNQSQTFTPDVEHDGATDFTYCDCPGFLDNRGPEINIANAVNIKQTIGRARSVRVIVLINYYSLVAERGRGIKELIHILRDLFGGSAEHLVKHASALLVGVSRAPVSVDGDLKEMDEFVDLIMDKSDLDEEQGKMIDALGVNTFVSHPVEGMGNDSWLTRTDLIDRINALDKITKPANIFSTVLTVEDEQALHDIAGKMQARIVGFMNERKYEEAALALDQFCVIDVIDNNRVTRLLQAVKVREEVKLYPNFFTVIVKASSTVIVKIYSPNSKLPQSSTPHSH